MKTTFTIQTLADRFRIGHAQDDLGGTGVTVIYFPDGARAGCDISGGGPASRETPLTLPLTADNPINAIVLSGGSAFGLAASDGVMRALEERGIGYSTPVGVVPLVCQSCIYDLAYKDPAARPDAEMGYRAAQAALLATSGRSGNVGGGVGATVGKIGGFDRSCKSGLGLSVKSAGGLWAAAVTVVNAFGDIYDPSSGQIIAGARSADGKTFLNTVEELYRIAVSGSQKKRPSAGEGYNTTISAVITNAALNKAQASKIASMARNAYARCIRPVGTMMDGDTIYAASVGTFDADINLTGILAADALEGAILDAVRSATGQTP